MDGKEVSGETQEVAQNDKTIQDNLQRSSGDQTEQSNNKTADDRLRLWQWIILIYFAPIAGIIGWIIWRKSKPKKARIAIIVALVLFVISLTPLSPSANMKAYIVQPFAVPSVAMAPTIVPGNRVLINKFVYRFTDPSIGDIVIFSSPKKDNGVFFIKRIVATGGDTVEQRNGIVYVNGKKLKTDYKTIPGDTYSFEPIKIEKGFVFVMGDNRINSSDSRVYGPISISSIKGQAFMIYWPFTLQPDQHKYL